MMDIETFQDITAGIAALWNGDGLACADYLYKAGVTDLMIIVFVKVLLESLDPALHNVEQLLIEVEGAL